MNIEETLKTLCALPSVSGGEKNAHEALIKQIGRAHV